MKTRWILGVFLLTSLTAFQAEDPETQAAVQKLVAEKVKQYKAEAKAACRRELLEKAGSVADSILLARARMGKDSALVLPPSIPKPALPTDPDVPDTLVLEPLWMQDSLIDTTQQY